MTVLFQAAAYTVGIGAFVGLVGWGLIGAIIGALTGLAIVIGFVLTAD